MMFRRACTSVCSVALASMLVNCGMNPITENHVVAPEDGSGGKTPDSSAKIKPTAQNGAVSSSNGTNNTPPPLETKGSSVTGSGTQVGGNPTTLGTDPTAFMNSAQDLERLRTVLASPQFNNLVAQFGVAGAQNLNSAQLNAILSAVGGGSALGEQNLGAALGGVDLTSLLNGNFAGVIPPTNTQTAGTPQK
ncbi:MAG: hypothetical protein FJ146_02525 [Deltaproteobacteria bacterium]|nr:hypothetical protein [Deltaproteobacteria bacterium]